MATMYEKIMRQVMARQSSEYGVFNDGDYYIDDEGTQLLCCGVCHEKKQTMVYISTQTVDEFNEALEEFAIAHPDLEEFECRKQFMNIRPPKNKRRNIGVVGVPCKCQRDFKDKLTKAEINDHDIALIKRNKYECFPTPYLLKETFNKYGENVHINKAKGYVKEIGKLINEKKNGLVLCGSAGAGKTVAALCLANALLDRKFNVIFKIQQEITFVDYNDRNQMLNSLINCGILIIDDFNLELVNDAGREMLFYIIDSRIKRGKPIVVTSNHTKDAFKHPKSDVNKRIFDRLNEVCYIVEDSTNNYRQKN